MLVPLVLRRWPGPTSLQDARLRGGSCGDYEGNIIVVGGGGGDDGGMRSGASSLIKWPMHITTHLRPHFPALHHPSSRAPGGE